MAYRKNPNGSLRHNIFLPKTPDVPALARTVDNSISTSTEILLDTATTFLQVYAIAKDVYLKYGTDDVTASNFDEVIPAGQVVNLMKPGGVTAINVIERESGATVIVVEK